MVKKSHHTPVVVTKSIVCMGIATVMTITSMITITRLLWQQLQQGWCILQQRQCRLQQGWWQLKLQQGWDSDGVTWDREMEDGAVWVRVLGRNRNEFSLWCWEFGVRGKELDFLSWLKRGIDGLDMIIVLELVLGTAIVVIIESRAWWTAGIDGIASRWMKWIRMWWGCRKGDNRISC